MATFLAFKGAVLKFSIGSTDQNDEKCISTEVFKFCKSSKCFKRSAEKVLRLTVRNLPGHKCELDSAKCLLNTMSGVCQPSLLLCHLPRKHTGRVELSVFVMEDYDSLSLLGRFSVDQTQISRLDFHFIDGPSVCWTSEGAVYQAKYDSQLKKFTLDSIALGSSMKEQPRADFTLHWCGVLRDETIAMGATVDSAQQPSRWKCINLSRRDIHEISLVPSVYVPIATCLSPELDETVAVVASKQCHVCAVNCQEKKVIKQWNDVEVILIEDFLQNGSEQILFLHQKDNTSEVEELCNYSLIDVRRGMCSIEHNQTLPSSQLQSVTYSLQRTAKALRTRVQAMKSTLHEAKLECHEKLKMVENSCKVLKDINSFQCPSDEKQLEEKNPGLFCLLEGDLGEGKQYASYKVPESTLSIKELWQRIVNDRWIIGANIENIGESAMTDLQLGLVACGPALGISYSSKKMYSDNSKTCTQSKMFQHFHDSYDKKAKKMKQQNSYLTFDEKLLPGNLARLTAVTSLPQFTQSNTCLLSVVLTWNSHSINGSIDQQSMHCGFVELNTEQVVNASLTLNKCADRKSLQQDITALKSVSVATELVFQGTFTGAHQVMAIVKNTVDDLPLLQTDTGEQRDIFGQVLPLLQENGPLSGCGVVLREGLNGQVILITRNKNQVFLLLHKLRHVLPNDVKIVADPAFDLLRLRDGISALNYEVTNLKKNLHKLIEKAGTTQPGSCIVIESYKKGTEESVRDLREGFKRKREREVIAREEISSQKSDFKKLWWDFMVDQMLTDTAVGKT
ncbi:uncharacterized protein [Acropora muricata]|uniref:uncharacterized protein isoform X2 n=1 Tax=Acropora muricata TaxID=159855 RepID=UPI0034E53E4D